MVDVIPTARGVQSSDLGTLDDQLTQNERFVMDFLGILYHTCTRAELVQSSLIHNKLVGQRQRSRGENKRQGMSDLH